MALDANAMYRAGFARGTKGRNIAVEQRIGRQEAFTKYAYGIIGDVVINTIQDTYSSLQKFRDKLESQSSAGLIKIEKLPRENSYLNESIMTISSNFRKANRKAHTAIGIKARREAKQERNKWMTQMIDLNEALEQYKAGSAESQGFARVAVGVAGEDNKGGNVNLSPGNHGFENLNTAEQANGEMAQLLRWNLDGGYMEVVRNGKWITEEGTGKAIYIDKGIENNKVLKKAYEKYENKLGGEGVDDANIMSYQEWAQDKDQGTLIRKKYSELKFGKGEDSKMGDNLAAFKKMMIRNAKGEAALSWDETVESEKRQFVGNINSYSDATFRDFYFGGYSFDYSSNRMNETAPAYKELKGRGLIPPGTQGVSTPESNREWEGALTTLKAQSMVKGSTFRQTVAEDQWEEMKNAYTSSQTDYQDKQAKKHADNANRYRQQTKSINYYNIKGSSIAKEQVDPIVNIFNTAKDDQIIPAQTVTWLDDVEGNSIQFGKDKDGWYMIKPEYGIDGQGRKIMTSKKRYNGTKDEVASGLGINATVLGYNFSEQPETTLTVSTYTPGGDDIKVKKKKADIISQIDMFDKRPLKGKTVEELQKILNEQKNKIKQDIKPRIFPKRPGLNN